ncbi:MAG: hypothetical protein EOM20_09045, partial [Spartobacteria bacterium]|nr:hypothetical protein [Spartobacteria bacterium]
GVLGGAPGARAGGLVAGQLNALMFAGSNGYDVYESAMKEVKNGKLTEDEAIAASLISSSINFGAESVDNVFDVLMTMGLLNPGKAAAGASKKRIVGFLKDYGFYTAKQTGIELAQESVQAESESAVRRAYKLEGAQPAGQAMADVMAPTIASTFLQNLMFTSGSGTAMAVNNSRQFRKHKAETVQKLEKEGATPEFVERVRKAPTAKKFNDILEAERQAVEMDAVAEQESRRLLNNEMARQKWEQQDRPRLVEQVGEKNTERLENEKDQLQRRKILKDALGVQESLSVREAGTGENKTSRMPPVETPPEMPQDAPQVSNDTTGRVQGETPRVDSGSGPVVSEQDKTPEAQRLAAEYPDLWQEAGEFQAAAEPAQERLNAALGEVVGEVDGVEFKGNQKSRKSMIQKVVRKRDSGEADYSMSQLKDHARGTVVLKSFDDAPKTVQALQRRLPGLRGEVTIDKPLNDFGYRGVHLSGKDESGVGFEIQIHTQESWALKEKSDLVYRKWRNAVDRELTPAERAEMIRDKAESVQAWAGIWDGITPPVKESISSSVAGLEMNDRLTSSLGSQGTQAPSINNRADSPPKFGRKSTGVPSSRIANPEYDITQSPDSQLPESPANVNQTFPDRKAARDHFQQRGITVPYKYIEKGEDGRYTVNVPEGWGTDGLDDISPEQLKKVGFKEIGGQAMNMLRNDLLWEIRNQRQMINGIKNRMAATTSGRSMGAELRNYVENRPARDEAGRVLTIADGASMPAAGAMGEILWDQTQYHTPYVAEYAGMDAQKLDQVEAGLRNIEQGRRVTGLQIEALNEALDNIENMIEHYDRQLQEAPNGQQLDTGSNNLERQTETEPADPAAFDAYGLDEGTDAPADTGRVSDGGTGRGEPSAAGQDAQRVPGAQDRAEAERDAGRVGGGRGLVEGANRESQGTYALSREVESLYPGEAEQTESGVRISLPDGTALNIEQSEPDFDQSNEAHLLAFADSVVADFGDTVENGFPIPSRDDFKRMPKSVQAEYGRKILKNTTIRPTALTDAKSGTIKISKAAWNNPDVHREELFHVGFSRLTASEKRAVIKEYGSEEQAYRDGYLVAMDSLPELTEGQAAIERIQTGEVFGHSRAESSDDALPFAVARRQNEALANVNEDGVQRYMQSRGVNPGKIKEAVALQLEWTDLIGGASIVPYEKPRAEARENNKGSARDRQRLALESLQDPGNDAVWRDVWKDGDIVSAVVSSLVSPDVSRSWPIEGFVINTPRDFMALAMQLRNPYQESMKIVYLDAGDRVIEGRVVSVGVINASYADARILLRQPPPGAAKAIISHNHPSGRVNFSKEDIAITRKIVDASKMSSVPVVDHIITDDWKYFSFAESSTLSFPNHSPSAKKLKRLNRKERKVVIPEGKPLPEWSVVSRDELVKIENPTHLYGIFGMLRQASKDHGHMIVLDVQNKITAVHRFPLADFEKKSAADRFAEVLLDNPSHAVIFDLPVPTDNAKQFTESMQDKLGSLGVNVLDTIDADNNSLRENGFVKESEPVYAVDRLGFYSPLERALDGMKQETFTPQQLKGMIAKAPGVKQEELDDLGFFDWLDGIDGKVTKQQALGFVQNGGVQLQEVVKGAANEDEVAAWWNDEGGADQEIPFDELNALEREDAVRQYREEVLDYDEGGTKYGQYQLPGGENYREVLLTVPTKPDAQTIWKREWDAFTESMRAKYGNGWANYDSRKKMSDADRNMLEHLEKQSDEFGNITDSSGITQFHSGHWDESNVLAHVRLNDRTGPNGESILFAEEIQSDWHQEGRKEGYKSPGKQNQLIEEANNILKKYNYDLLEKSLSTPIDQQIDSASINLYNELSEEDATALERIGHEYYYDTDRVGTVPNAPHKKSWQMLAFKRVLRMAVEQGYDSVAWTPGDVQAERYDLSKQVESIQWARNNRGNYDLQAYLPDGTWHNIANDVPAAKLEEYIGKDPAKKITDSIGADGELEGNDLKVGGEGMKGFYDKILPAEVNKYVKKMGGKVGVTSFASESKGNLSVEENSSGRFFVARDGIGQTKSFDSRSEAESAMQALFEKDSSGQEVWNLPITDAMREQIEQGQPRYAVARKWDDDFPKVTIHTTRANIESKHKALFDAAKSGDLRSADELVIQVAKKDRIAELGKTYPNAIVVPVRAEEATGRNKIPGSYASYISAVTGLELDTDIIQSVRAHHTGKGAFERIVTRALFDGTVKQGADYIIVDDHVTQGGTLRALKEHIEAGGGNIVAVSTLTASKGSTTLAIRPITVRLLKDKFGDERFRNQLQQAGIADEIEQLTESEGRYLLKLSPDTLRNRINEAGSQRRSQEKLGFLQGKDGPVNYTQGELPFAVGRRLGPAFMDSIKPGPDHPVESTEEILLRNQLRKESRAALDGYKAAKREFADVKKVINAERDNIAEAQAELVRFVKKFLPPDLRGKLLSDVRNIGKAKTTETAQNRLDAAIKRIPREIDEARRRGLIERLHRSMSVRKLRNLPRYEKAQAELNQIREIMDMKPEAVEEAVELLANQPSMTEAEETRLHLLATYGNLADKSLAFVEAAVRDINDLMTTQRRKQQTLRDDFNAKMEPIAEQAKHSFSRGQVGRPMTEVERQQQSAFWRVARNWGTLDDTFETALDRLERFHKDSDTFDGPITRWAMSVVEDAYSAKVDGVLDSTAQIHAGFSEAYGVKGQAMNRLARKNTKRQERSGVYLYPREQVRAEIAAINEELEGLRSRKRPPSAKRLKTLEHKRAALTASLAQTSEREEIPLSQNEAIYMWLGFQAEDSRLKMEQHGYNDQTRADLEAFMSEGSRKWAQWQLDFYNNQDRRKALQKAYLDTFFHEMHMEEVYNGPRFYRVQGARGDDNDVLQGKVATPGGTVMSGSFIARVAHSRAPRVMDANKVLMAYMDQMEHFKAWGRPMKELRAVLQNKEVQQIIEDYHNRDVKESLNKQMLDMAAGHAIESTRIAWLDKMRGNFATSKIGLGLSPGVKQLISMPMYIHDIGVMPWVAGGAYYLSHPNEAAKDARRILEHPAMRWRSHGRFDINTELSRERGTSTLALPSLLEQVRDGTMILTKMNDKVAIALGGLADYRWHLMDARKRGIADPEKYAINRMMTVAHRSQQSARIFDRGRWQKWGSVMNMFTTFRSGIIQMQRISNSALRNMMQGRGSYKANARRYMMARFVIPVLYQMAANIFKGGDPWPEENEEAQAIPGIPNSILRAIVIGNYSGYFMAADYVVPFIEGLTTGDTYMSYGTVPLLAPAQNVGRFGSRINKAITGKRDLKASDFVDLLFEAVDMGTGLPATRTKKIAEGTKKAIDGEADSELLAVAGYEK